LKRRSWRRRLVLFLGVCFLLLLVFIGTEVAIGWGCHLQGKIHPPIPQPQERKIATARIRNYSRPEDDTYLSYPEWYIVWSYQEKADFQESTCPEHFHALVQCASTGTATVASLA
jgi:hypothetical protein